MKRGRVVIQCNGFVDSAMASAPDGTGVTGMTPKWTRAWAHKKAAELRVAVEDNTLMGAHLTQGHVLSRTSS
jgi:hypothetical protein